MRNYKKWACCLIVGFAVSLCSAQTKARSGADPIVAADLLTVKEPGSQAESRLRVIRLTTQSGATGYGDYFDFGLPAKNEEETLARLVNRYGEQRGKTNFFVTDPSMRAVGGAHTVLGKTAAQTLNAKPVMDLRHGAFFPREGFGPMWQGPGKSGLVIALQAALLDLAGQQGPSQVRLCPSISTDVEVNGKRRLLTADEVRQKVSSLKQAGFTAVRLELADALEDEMVARGECAPYRYPIDVLGMIDRLVSAAKEAAGPDMHLVLAANMNLSTDGMTMLALRCQRIGVTLLENPMELRHLHEQGQARKEFSMPLGFGGDYHVNEDFAQGIQQNAGTVLVPDAGNIGGVRMLAQTADLAKDAQLRLAPVVKGGPLSLLTVARSLYGRDEVLWLSSPYQEQWLNGGGVLKTALQMKQGVLVSESCEIDETKFHVKCIAQVNTKTKKK
ncbi:MAG: enolase C-terminal domain-like protein [Coraliomargarita sp.]